MQCSGRAHARRDARPTAGGAALSERLYRGYGSLWRSDIALDAFDPADGPAPDAIAVLASPAPITRPVLRSINRGTVHADGFRLPWHDEVAFDFLAPAHIAYTPGPNWSGTFPAAFHATVAALALAWRGALPFHASAVERDGRAVLIAGAPGAGKSTLTAQVLAHGARLVGDDLTVLDPPLGAAPLTVGRGRSTIRLHRDTAGTVAAEACMPVSGDPRGKWLVRPIARTSLERLPLAGFLLLGQRDGPIAPRLAATVLADHLFRPRWLEALPDHPARLRAVLSIAARVPVHGIAVRADFHADRRVARRIGELVAALTGSSRILPP